MARSPRFATTVGNGRERRTDFRAASAAILGQKNQQVTHGREIDGIYDRAAFALRADQAGIREDEKLRGHRIRRRLQTPRDLTCRQALRPGFHQQTEHLKPCLLGERGQSFDGVKQFHTSWIAEIKRFVKIAEWPTKKARLASRAFFIS
jgi:hypothetical protein